jgi:cell division protein FtsB
MDLRVVRERTTRLQSRLKVRPLPEPEEGMRQAGEYVLQVVDETRPAWQRAYELRRKIATTVVAVLTVWFFVHVFFGANGTVAYGKKRAENNRLQEEIKDLQKDNDLLQGHVTALKSDAGTIEREAREQLHYAKPGEVIYVTPAPVAPPAQNNKTQNNRAGK